MRSPPKNNVGLMPIIRKRFRLGGVQNLVHTKAKLTGKVEKVFSFMNHQEAAEKVVEGASSTPQALKRGHIFSDLTHE